MLRALALLATISLALTAPAYAASPDECQPGKSSASQIVEDFTKNAEIAEKYGVVMHRLDGTKAQDFIKIADEIQAGNPYPGTLGKVTSVIVFVSTGEDALPRSRIFIFAGDECQLYQLDWSTQFVSELLMEIAKRSV